MVQKKTAELQGFHRSFKVRALLISGAPGPWSPEWPVGEARSSPVGSPGLLPAPYLGPGAAPAVCARVVESATDSPVSRALVPLEAFLSGQRPLPVGALSYESLASPSWCIALGGASAGHSPIASTMRSVESFLQEPQAGRAAGLQAHPSHTCPPRWSEEWGCRLDATHPRPAPPRHPRPRHYFLLEREVSVVAPWLRSLGLRASLGGSGRCWAGSPKGLAQGTQ